MPRLIHFAAALAAAALTPAGAAAQLVIGELHRVAAGTAARDRPAVVTGPSGYAVFWEEAPSAETPDATGRALQLVRQLTALDGRLLDTAAVVVGDWTPQRSAAAAGRSNISWLAYSFAERTMAAGDRDVGLLAFTGFFQTPSQVHRLTQDRLRSAPTTHESPAALYDPDVNQLIVANTAGEYRGEARPGRRSYDSVNVEIRVLDPAGTPLRHFIVKGPDGAGEALSPSLAILPGHWRERYILAYISNAGARDAGPDGYSVYLELFDRNWRVVGGRHMARPRGGASHPSVATVGDKLYVTWVDNGTGDVVVSELDQTLHPVWPMRLREALVPAGFVEQFGAGTPALGAPTLFTDRDSLGLAFVVTWNREPSAGPAHQEIFRARIAYRQ